MNLTKFDDLMIGFIAAAIVSQTGLAVYNISMIQMFAVTMAGWLIPLLIWSVRDRVYRSSLKGA